MAKNAQALSEHNSQASAVVEPKVLVDAKNLLFGVPVFRPVQRKLLTTPTAFLRDFYLNRRERKIQTIIDRVDFQLLEGQRLAVIGENGAGKSTLLRLVGQIYYPTGGQLNLDCNPAGLFDMSLGFLPEATGLENAYLRGVQMGYSLGTVRERLDRIIEFSGLDRDKIDQPLNTYSTGMRLRLAVSVSLMIEPDVILMDEWIGSGDTEFRSRIQDRLDEIVQGSRGMILASHSENLLRRVCTHGLVLRKGKKMFYGPVEDALDFYKSGMSDKAKELGDD